LAIKDLRECLQLLEEKGLLYRIKSCVNKDTELMPLVRWQYRGLPEEGRKAFLFENVTDASGKKYSAQVAVCVLGASRTVYATAMGVAPEEIVPQWLKGLASPVLPRLVDRAEAPVKEEIHQGEELAREGLEEFPIPISTPGYDPAPYLTAPYWVTRDPETGVRNVGTYRAMVKGRATTGVFVHPAQHIGIHWTKCKKLGKPLEAALVVGGPPVVGMVSVAKIPYGVDEFAIAGGIGGAPIELVKCETVDLEVPARAEIVCEGEITMDYVEPEGPFGEFTGYMGARQMNPIFKIKCLTHRRNPVYQAFLSQFPPSESSLIRGISFEAILYKLLKYDCNIPGVLGVAFHEGSGSWAYCIIQLEKQNPSQPWQALNAAVAFDPTIGKIIIAVDEDINPRDPDAVNWALSYRMQPHLDLRVTTGKASMLDLSAAPPGSPEEEARFPKPRGTSAVLIDATRKWDYPPVSLPQKVFMEKAREIWNKEGLSPLVPKNPWHGYTLGYWSGENESEARLAVQGLYHQNIARLSEGGRKI